jgi:hypothetical protein
MDINIRVIASIRSFRQAFQAIPCRLSPNSPANFSTANWPDSSLYPLLPVDYAYQEYSGSSENLLKAIPGIRG